MANPNIGECPCPTCGGTAYVRKQCKGAELLYLSCDDCGHISPRLPKGQDYILNKAVMYGPDGKHPAVTPPAVSEVTPPPAPAPTPTPAPAKSRAFATLLG